MTAERRSLIERFPGLRRLGRAGRSRELPMVRQLAATECGAASLAMVLGMHGRRDAYDEVRRVLQPGRDGTSARELVEVARRFGLRGRAVKLEPSGLAMVPRGAVLHWQFNHYVVFVRLERDEVEILDPAFGRRRIALPEFGKSFTGVALIFDPGDDFGPSSGPSRSVLRHIRPILLGSGLWARILVTSVFLQLFVLSVPMLTGALVDRVVPRNDADLLVVLVLGFGGVVVFHGLVTLVRGQLLLHLRTEMDARMTMGFVEHLTSLPFAFFQARPAGDLLMRMSSNSTVREILTSTALSGLIDGSLVLLYLGLVFAISTSMGLLVLGLGVLNGGVYFLMRRRRRELMAQNLEIDARSRSYEVELLTGIETLKAMGAEGRALERWSNLFVDGLNVSLERGSLAALSDALTGMLKLGSPLVVLAFGTLEVLRGQLSLGTMLGLNALANAFLGPLASLIGSAMQLQLLGTYLERLNDVLDTAPEQERGRGRPAARLAGRVALEGVSFRYKPSAPLAVNDVSVTIQPGQMVAIVGRSGAGKSTLANLLCGLYLPESGRILLDGVNLRELDLGTVRRQIGMITQTTHLFGASIHANIALADPSLSLDAVKRAAQLAGLHDEIMAMPMGYDTLLVDRGASLSGGQRQRLALARALVHQPALLLLDEATSALDNLTERKVQAALASLQTTRIVIAHRLSTIIDADLILVMDGGKLVEGGTHAQLVADGGLYASLVAAGPHASEGRSAGADEVTQVPRLMARRR